MGNDSTENTSKITTSERDSGLGGLAVIRLLTRKAVVDHLNNGFERSEFHHGVRNLASPKRIQALVESGTTFLCNDRGNAIESACCEWGDSSLHADLDSFEGTESNIGDEFSRSTSCQVDRRLVLIGVFSPDEVRVEFLEEFVSSVFEGSLCAVAEESWRPSSVDSAESFGAANLAPGLEVASVHLGVNLATAFN